MKCKICNAESVEMAHYTILNEYNIIYFQCTHCSFVQTEEPYWLEAAYANPIAPSDDGLVFRNLILSQITSQIIPQFFNPNAHFVDYGSGYGLFVRLMRDIRFKFDWFDRYCQNLFAQGLEAKENQSYELVTAFEVFEHFVNPLDEIQKILQFSRNILLSTELLPATNPKPGEWCYYAPHEGQHISLYTLSSLSIVAKHFNLNLYSNGTSLHLLTEKKIDSTLFATLTDYDAEKLRNFLQRSRSYLKTFEKVAQDNSSAPSLPSLLSPPNSLSQIIPQELPAMQPTFGINIAGYVNGEFGIGEGVRANIRSIEAAGIPFVVNNFTKSPHRKLDTSYQNFSQDNPYPINLIQINADEVKNFFKQVGTGYLENRYNIGFWAWELPTFPAEWVSAFKHFHEIWTYSNHCAEAISVVAPIPVIKMMPSLSLSQPLLDREALNLPKDKFIFLFIFDFFSRMERKNPLAVIDAFKQAFGNDSQDVFLIIKSSNSEKFLAQREQLNTAIQDHPSIHHLDGYLSKDEINALIYNCDCYVSLHRCEGFGLTMAEAMFYGRPVIATGYSSNTEFMNVGNSFLVNYNLVKIESNMGPYKKGNVWAEPDINHASHLMQFVFNNQKKAQQIGQKGKETIQSLLSLEVLGQKIKERLQYIYQLTHQPTALSPSSSFAQSLAIANVDQQPLPSTKNSEITSKDAYPLVSICIPTYNGENYIAEALASAFAQSYPNLEIIVSDDGSTDKTIEIAQSFQTKTTLDFKIILHRNYGLAQNWNFCVSQVKGKYLKFLFQDDLLEPHCIEKMVALANRDPAVGMVFSPRGIVLAKEAESHPILQAAAKSIRELHTTWSNLKPIQLGRELLSDEKWLKHPINKIGEPSTVLIATEVFHKLGLFDEGLSQYTDLDMWFRIMGHYKIGFIDEKLSALRIHPGQQTWKNFAAGENKKDVYRLYEKMLRSSEYRFLTPEQKEIVRQKLALKSQQLVPNLPRLMEQYRNSATHLAALADLRQVRRQIAEKWLSLPAEQLEPAFRGELGKTHQLLLSTGMKSEALNEDEQHFIEQLAIKYPLATDNKETVRYWLVTMLYQPAYPLSFSYKNAAIPRWFFHDFLKFIVETPSYFNTQEEIQKYYEYLQELALYIHAHFLSRPDAEIWQGMASALRDFVKLTPLLSTEFNLKEVCTKHAEIMGLQLKQSGYVLDWDLAKVPLDSKAKIRVGIVLERLDDYQDTFVILPLLKNLEREKYEVFLYYLEIKNRAVGDYCKSLADREIQLPENLVHQVHTLRADHLDILIVGTSPMSASFPYAQLVLHRLAKLQMTQTVSSPMTVGTNTIDYCIAGQLATNSQDLQHYQETLVTVEGCGFCLSYPPESPAGKVQPTRKSWGASEQSIVFISGADAVTITPDLRKTWVKIIAAVPRSILVVYPFHLTDESYPMLTFFNQMRSLFTEFGLDKKRFIVIKRLPERIDFQECLKQADIYLDAFPYARIDRLAEALSIGLPTVVREGRILRSRQSSAMLRALQIPELISESENSYIELATKLGNHPEWCQYLRTEIQKKMANNPPFFDGRTYTTQLKAIWERLLQMP